MRPDKRTASEFISKVNDKKNEKKTPIIVSAIICLMFSIAAGGFFGSMKAKEFGIQYAFTTKAGLCITAVFFVVSMLFIGGYMMYNNYFVKEDEGFSRSSKTTYGDGKVLKENEYKDFLKIAQYACEIEKGYPIGRSKESGKIVAIPKAGNNNRNMAICGCQGVGKSVGIIRDLAISAGTMGHSVIITDPKGELTKDLYSYYKELGYKNVWQLNLINHWVSNGWDILGEIENGSIDVLCDTIIANTRPTDDHDFFDDIETLLLKALMLYVYEVYEEGQRTIGNVFSILEFSSLDELDDMFHELKKINPKSKALGAYNMFSGNSNKSNAFLGLGGRIRMFDEEAIKYMTGANEIDLQLIAKEKTAIFCVFPDTNSTYNVIISSFITLLLSTIFEYGKLSDSGKCDVPVDLILDEFPSIGTVNDFDRMLSTARGYDIGIQFVFQTIPQIKTRFGKDLYLHYLGSCDYNLFLGCNDTDTAETYSELSRGMTVDVTTEKKKLQTLRLSDYTQTTDFSKGEGKRPVYLPGDLLNFDNEKMIVFCRGKNPVELYKLSFWELEESLVMKKINQNSIIPEWCNSDGCNLKNGEKVKTYDELYKEAGYVVKDYLDERTGEYVYTRDELCKKANKVMKKYAKEGRTPNGMPLIINGERVTDASKINFDNIDDSSSKKNIKAEERRIKKDLKREMKAIQKNNAENNTENDIKNNAVSESSESDFSDPEQKILPRTSALTCDASDDTENFDTDEEKVDNEVPLEGQMTNESEINIEDALNRMDNKNPVEDLDEDSKEMGFSTSEEKTVSVNNSNGGGFSLNFSMGSENLNNPGTKAVTDNEANDVIANTITDNKANDVATNKPEPEIKQTYNLSQAEKTENEVETVIDKSPVIPQPVITNTDTVVTDNTKADNCVATTAETKTANPDARESVSAYFEDNSEKKQENEKVTSIINGIISKSVQTSNNHANQNPNVRDIPGNESNACKEVSDAGKMSLGNLKDVDETLLRLIKAEVEKELSQRTQLKKFEKEENTLSDEQIRNLIRQEIKLSMGSVIAEISNEPASKTDEAGQKNHQSISEYMGDKIKRDIPIESVAQADNVPVVSNQKIQITDSNANIVTDNETNKKNKKVSTDESNAGNDLNNNKKPNNFNNADNDISKDKNKVGEQNNVQNNNSDKNKARRKVQPYNSMDILNALKK